MPTAIAPHTTAPTQRAYSADKNINPVDNDVGRECRQKHDSAPAIWVAAVPGAAVFQISRLLRLCRSAGKFMCVVLPACRPTAGKRYEMPGSAEQRIKVPVVDVIGVYYVVRHRIPEQVD